MATSHLQLPSEHDIPHRFSVIQVPGDRRRLASAPKLSAIMTFVIYRLTVRQRAHPADRTYGKYPDRMSEATAPSGTIPTGGNASSP
jgi:hypothetical protein